MTLFILINVLASENSISHWCFEEGFLLFLSFFFHLVFKSGRHAEATSCLFFLGWKSLDRWLLRETEFMNRCVKFVISHTEYWLCAQSWLDHLYHLSSRCFRSILYQILRRTLYTLFLHWSHDRLPNTKMLMSSSSWSMSCLHFNWRIDIRIHMIWREIDWLVLLRDFPPLFLIWRYHPIIIFFFWDFKWERSVIFFFFRAFKWERSVIFFFFSLINRSWTILVSLHIALLKISFTIFAGVFSWEETLFAQFDTVSWKRALLLLYWWLSVVF